jgi:NADPH-dependent 2,4-dienoyl-CoA reductase/sulfur reductase-like enzyme
MAGMRIEQRADMAAFKFGQRLGTGQNGRRRGGPQVGDSNGLLESAMRERHIKWICNAKVTEVEAGKMFVAEHNDKGEVIKEHELPFAYSMMLPAFKGIDAVFGIGG